MSHLREAMPSWRICRLRPDLSVLPTAYRGSHQAETITVEVQAPSGSWFPLPPPPHRGSWTTDDDGLRRLALALARTRRLWLEAQDLHLDLRRHLEPLVLRSGDWELTAHELEQMLLTAAYEASGAADLHPGDSGLEW
jgi:hypothetical protein